MHAGGYLDRNVANANPGRLAIVVALHGVAIAALMLAPAEIVRKPTWFPPTIVDQITKEQPPEALPQPPKDPVKRETVDPLPPLVSTNIWREQLPLTQNSGGTEIVTPPIAPIPLPVMIEASFVRGVQIQPDYPTSLARQEIEGYATVRVLIGTDGRVRDVQQVSATDPEFFRATQRQALRYWRFKPATRDGIPVESWREMTVRFQLQG